MTFFEQILFWAKVQPGKYAALYQSEGLTFAELAVAVAVAQQKLAAAGIARGEVVALACNNPVYRLPLLLALMGMSVTTINCMEDDVLPAAALGAECVLTGNTLRLPAGLRQIVVHRQWFALPPGVAAPPAMAPEFGEGQAAAVWFSSGSTGNPRPLATTWRAMARLISNRQWRSRSSGCERAAIVPSMAAYFGCSEALSFLAAGAGVVFIHNENEIIQLAELFAFDHLVMSALQMKAIVDIAKARRYRFHTLRGAQFGGGQASSALMADALAYICRDITAYYGATETGPVAGIDCAHILERPLCAGHVLPWAGIRIVDAQLNDVADGVEGEIIVRSNAVSLPWRGKDAIYAQTGEIWIRPGDRGYLGEDGALYVFGRMSDVINIGGEKFAPERIEDILCRHEKIRAAAAIGKMTETSGIAALHVFLVADGGLSHEDINAWWRLHGMRLPLARIVFVDALPMTASGKIARMELALNED